MHVLSALPCLVGMLRGGCWSSSRRGGRAQAPGPGGSVTRRSSRQQASVASGGGVNVDIRIFAPFPNTRLLGHFPQDEKKSQ